MKNTVVILSFLFIASKGLAQATVNINGQSLSCGGSVHCVNNICECSDGTTTDLGPSANTSNFSVDPSARVESTVDVGSNAKILGSSIVTGRTVIGPNSVVINSTVTHSLVGPNARLVNSKVSQSNVGANAVLVNKDVRGEIVPPNATRVGSAAGPAN